jgi:hypothetical protein
VILPSGVKVACKPLKLCGAGSSPALAAIRAQEKFGVERERGMLDLALAIWCVPTVLLLAAILLISRASSAKSSGFVCPVCGSRFYTKHVVDNVVMLPCGHKFAREPSLTTNHGPH